MQREFPPKLLPSEDLKSVKIFDLKKPSIAHPSSFKAIESLTGTDSALDIGSNGPSKASLATEANKNIEELHKFEVLFGRDSLRVALDLALERPRLLKETILALARFQGTETGTNNEEEPGRIPHEIRNPQEDPIAQRLTREKGWKWPYYGSIDSTPLYISAIRKYVDIKGLEFLNEIYTAKDGKKKTIFDSLTESVSWIKGRMDQNQEGLLEFKAAFPGSHINQAWKDSADSYHHLDGAIASHKKGIASLE
ncbi:hypothetical protein M1307_03300 [Patescibacteria group bacterium]|nr:hypothetical protein [Patescibacteria group bacterium]